MPELGFVLYLLALSYAFGQLWYSIFEFRHEHWLRVMSYPLLGIVGGEALWAKYLASGPDFFGVHVLVAFVATLIAVLVDIGIHALRPTHEKTLEMPKAAHA